jgi:hypothetical protein
MKLKILGLLVASSLGLMSAKAHAEDLAHGWAGAMGGISIPSLSGSSARGLWGLTVGAKLGSELGLGAYYEGSSKNEDFNGTEQAFNYSLYGVQFSYHFEGEAMGAYFGARVGISKVNKGGVNVSPVNYGAFGGYDYMIIPQLSVGGELAYMGVGSGSEGTNTVSSFSMLNFTGAVKFWF